MRTESGHGSSRLGGALRHQEQHVRERLGLLYPVLLCILAIAATALIIDNRTRLVGGSYEIDELRQRLAELQTRNRQLRLELSSLTAPADIEEQAARLGLQPPAPDQIHVLQPEPADQTAVPDRPREAARSAAGAEGGQR
jgi:cell division protein FtsL